MRRQSNAAANLCATIRCLTTSTARYQRRRPAPPHPRCDAQQNAPRDRIHAQMPSSARSQPPSHREAFDDALLDRAHRARSAAPARADRLPTPMTANHRRPLRTQEAMTVRHRRSTNLQDAMPALQHRSAHLPSHMTASRATDPTQWRREQHKIHSTHAPKREPDGATHNNLAPKRKPFDGRAPAEETAQVPSESPT